MLSQFGDSQVSDEPLFTQGYLGVEETYVHDNEAPRYVPLYLKS